LDSAGRALGLKVVPHIKPACPPWPIPLRHYYDAREDTECATYQHQLGSILARYPGAALVLASSTGAVERMVGSLTLEQRAELWKRRTTDFFRSIPKTVKVIIVEKSPQFAFDPVSCLARSAFWNTTPACGEDYPTATLVAVQYTRLEAGAAAGEERVRIFPTIAPLCSSTACSPLIGNTVAFRDERHLTPRYTLSQTGRWMPYLRWAVGLDSVAGHIADLPARERRARRTMRGLLAAAPGTSLTSQRAPETLRARVPLKHFSQPAWAELPDSIPLPDQLLQAP
jgi:hypothetical protein